MGVKDELLVLSELTLSKNYQDMEDIPQAKGGVVEQIVKRVDIDPYVKTPVFQPIEEPVENNDEAPIKEPTKPEKIDKVSDTPNKKEYPYLEGPDHIVINKNNFIIGKSSSCDYQITDHVVSRRHCKITNNGKNYYIEDLGSTNGTFINNKKVDSKFRLHPGKEIRIANRKYIWHE